jgi:hypothetical protein
VLEGLPGYMGGAEQQGVRQQRKRDWGPQDMIIARTGRFLTQHNGGPLSDPAACADRPPALSATPIRPGAFVIEARKRDVDVD